MDLEITKNARTTKVGRQTNKTRRERATTQDKELGTQPTLKEILKKEGKNGKAQAAKGQSQPTKGGAPKHNSK
jgi:hypothetical protein